MSSLRYLTAGESHGVALNAILEGLPAGVPVAQEAIDQELRRRQGGYGSGARMQIEQDHAEILSGVRAGKSLGSPIALLVQNKDASFDRLPRVAHPRPGHADLAGAIKYDHRDIRNILERASARETTSRVAVGAVCKQFLAVFDIDMVSHVVAIGSITARVPDKLAWDTLRAAAEASPVRCVDKDAERKMMAEVDAMKTKGDTLGGIFEIIVQGLPVGLGSHSHYDRRLDAILAHAVMAIHAVKAVEVGDGIKGAAMPGSGVQDEIFYTKEQGFYRNSNRAGGFEGGMTTGQPVWLRGYLKPLSTLMKPLKSINIDTKAEVKATVERSDVCTVPAAGVIGEAVVAFALANAFLDKFGGDSIKETRRNYQGYIKQVKQF